MNLHLDEWDRAREPSGGLASILGGIIGGTAGFFTGGPAGAYAGYKAGEETEEKIRGVAGQVPDALGLGGTDTAALHRDTDAARAAAEQMHGAFSAYVPRDAPQMTGPTPIQARQADSYGATAQTAFGALPVQVQQTSGQQAFGATPVTAPTAQAGWGRAADIAPAAQATGAPAQSSLALADYARAAGVNTAPSDEWRTGQQGLASTLARTATGQGPSVGVQQYRKSLGDIAAQAQGQAASARGNDRVFAKREAMMTSADKLSNAGLNEGLIRAQEAATAQGQLGALQTGARGQDIGLATTSAGFQQGANLQNASQRTAVNLANAAGETGTSQFNSGMGADLSKFNAGATNNRSLTVAGNANDMMKFNAGENGATSRFNAGQGLQAGEFNSGQATDLSKFNAGLGQANQLANADRSLQGGEFNASQTNELAKFNAGQGNQVGMFNAGQDTATAQFNAGQGNQVGMANNAQQIQVATANMDAKLRQMGMDDQQRAQYIDSWLRAQGLTMQGDTGIVGAQQADAAGKREFASGIVKGVSQTAAAYYGG